MNIMPVHDGGFNFSRRRIDFFQYIKMSHASLHPGKAGSCKQPLRGMDEKWVLKMVQNLNSNKINFNVSAGVRALGRFGVSLE